MTARWVYDQAAEDPAYVVTWLDGDGAIINFSAGYTFQVKLVNVVTGATVLTKTTNITGAATAPNVTVAWATSELNIAAGTYELHLQATTGGRQRVFRRGNPEHVTILASAT
jgi:hypothetical protein